MPRDTELESQYNEGIRLDEMFIVSCTCVETDRDHVCIHKKRSSLEGLLHDFIELPEEELKKKYNIKKDGRDWQLKKAKDDVMMNEGNLQAGIKKITYRIYDDRYIFYSSAPKYQSRGFVAYLRARVTRHIVNAPPQGNIGLLMTRRCQFSSFQNVFVTRHVAELNATGDASTMAPLYLYEGNK